MNAAENESPASAATLGGANINSNQGIFSNRAAPAAQANYAASFAALFISRRYGLSVPLAGVIATLSNIGGGLA